MNSTIYLSEARKNLPELADRVNAGHVYILSRGGRELAVLMSVDEYRRLRAIEQQRQKDFDTLVAPPPSDTLAEEAARDLRELAVQIVREQRSRHA